MIAPTANCALSSCIHARGTGGTYRHSTDHGPRYTDARRARCAVISRSRIAGLVMREGTPRMAQRVRRHSRARHRRSGVWRHDSTRVRKTPRTVIRTRIGKPGIGVHGPNSPSSHSELLFVTTLGSANLLSPTAGVRSRLTGWRSSARTAYSVFACHTHPCRLLLRVDRRPQPISAASARVPCDLRTTSCCPRPS
jgi:hypothetical protein